MKLAQKEKWPIFVAFKCEIFISISGHRWSNILTWTYPTEEGKILLAYISISFYIIIMISNAWNIKFFETMLSITKYVKTGTLQWIVVHICIYPKSIYHSSECSSYTLWCEGSRDLPKCKFLPRTTKLCFMKSKIGNFHKKEILRYSFLFKNGDHSGWFGLVVLMCKDIALCKLGISYKNISS